MHSYHKKLLNLHNTVNQLYFNLKKKTVKTKEKNTDNMYIIHHGCAQ